MGRRPGDPGGGRSRASLWIILAALFVSCSLAYMVLTVAVRRPGSLSLVYAVGPGRASGGEGREMVGGWGGEDDCCRGVEHLELWGAAVKWGTDHKFNTSRECCLACKAMCGGLDGPCLCDSWVFCGDKERCGSKFGECWLKKQNDVLFPALQESGERVIWTSGLIFGKGEGIVGFETDNGTLHIKLFPDCAPLSVAYIVELLRLRLCDGCQIHRAEGRGQYWDSEGNHIADIYIVSFSMESSFPYCVASQASFGPPYAMIQGTLEAGGLSFRKIPAEVCPTIRRGSVAWVGSGPEFFISLANHDEWQGAYTVFGSVLPEDMEIAEKIAILPTKPDVWNNINVSLLEKPVRFRLKRITNSHGHLNLNGNSNSGSRES
ncbi:DNA excision repair protein ERCC-4 [Cocos nucifera]|uniref:DNA excision repair protein ERCC-4 n=1 Tax=Cocos nucifera TaxID=13894 RepID=A0A8K0N4L9_COCNU|nr:DNA excision repair protein ERCC-4 [Cocos nucifera]